MTWNRLDLPDRGLPGRRVALAIAVLVLLPVALALPSTDVSPRELVAPEPVLAQGECDGDPFASGPYGTDLRDVAGDFTVPTLDGDWHFATEWTGCDSHVIVGFEEIFPDSRDVWSSSVASLLAESPDNVHYLFVSYAEDPEQVVAEVEAMKTRVDAALEVMTADRRVHWLPRLHYVTESGKTAGDWLPTALRSLGGLAPGVVATWQDADGAPMTMKRGGTGTSADLAPPLSETGAVSAPLAWYGKACDAAPDPVQDPAGKIALVERGDCSFLEKLNNAAGRGAVGVVVFTHDGPVVTMGCDPCTPKPAIPGVMIDRDPGADLRQALLDGFEVTATMDYIERSGAAVMLIDRFQRIREMGLMYFVGLDDPGGLRFTAHETRYFNFEWQRERDLGDELDDALVLTVWEKERDRLHQNLFGEIELPDAETLAGYDTMLFDLGQYCTDHRNVNCGEWDYLQNLYLCDADDSERCNTEITRYITTYGREGHWVTDVSPMLALLKDGLPAAGGTRRIRLSLWRQDYDIDFKVYLLDREKGTTPNGHVQMWGGGAFNESYNARHAPIHVDVPSNVERAEIAAFITGHGFGDDTENCAEFCNHTHHFDVNGDLEVVKEHPTAQTQYGCVEQIEIGTVPNQFGTWQYGRGGWCPGLDVPPWTVDITEAVRPGEWNTIRYRGLFRGQNFVPVPLPADQRSNFAGRIDMTSYVIFHCDGPCTYLCGDAPCVSRGHVPAVRRGEVEAR